MHISSKPPLHVKARDIQNPKIYAKAMKPEYQDF